MAAASIPSQKNILATIKSNLAFVTDITNIVSNSTMVVRNVVDSINHVKTTVNMIGANGGLIDVVEATNERLNDSKILKKDTKKNKAAFKRHLNEVLNIVKFVKKVAKASSKVSMSGLSVVQKIPETLNSIFESFNNIKFNPLIAIKGEMLKKTLTIFNDKIVPVVKDLSNNVMSRFYTIKVNGAEKTRFISRKAFLEGLTTLNETIFPAINKIVETINEFSASNVLRTRVRIMMMRYLLKKIKNLINDIKEIASEANLINFRSKLFIKTGNTIITAIKDVLVELDDFNPRKKIAKLRKLRRSAHLIFDVLDILIERTDSKTFKGIKGFFILQRTVRAMAFAAIIFKELEIITNSVKFGTLFFGKATKVLLESLPTLFSILEYIIDFFNFTEIHVPATAKRRAYTYKRKKTRFTYKVLFDTIGKFALVAVVFRLLRIIVVNASIAALASIPFALLAYPFMFVVWAIFEIIDFVEFRAKRINKDTIKNLLLISLVSMVIGIIGLSLFALSFVAEQVVMRAGWLGLLFLLIYATIVAIIPIILVGMLLATAAAGVAAGLGAIIVTIGAVVFIAYSLKLLEFVNLDKTLILSNVYTVIDVCRSIIDGLFSNDSVDDRAFNKAGKSKTWLGLCMKVIKGMGTGFVDIIKAFSASLILTFTLVSVVLILVTVMFLRIMQVKILQLNKERILSSVSTVTGIANFIIDSIFGMHEYNEDTKTIQKTQKYKESNFFSRLFGGIADLVTAVSASAILIFTFISIGAIFLMLGALKRIQTAEFDEGAIIGNVQRVIQVCKSVIDAVNAPSETKMENKDDGVLGKLLNLILPSNLKYAIDALLTMPFLALTWINIGMLKGIIGGLKEIKDFPEAMDIQKGVKGIMDTCKSVVTAINDSGFKISDVKHKIKLVTKLKTLINRFIRIGRKGDDEIGDIGVAITNIESISKYLSKLRTVLIPELDQLPNLKKQRITIGNVKEMSSLLSALEKFAKVSVTDAKNGLSNFIQLAEYASDEVNTKYGRRKAKLRRTLRRINRYTQIIRAISSMTNVGLDRLTNNSVANHKAFMKNNIDFIDKIGSVDRGNLRQAANIFEEMRRFSESINGNFAELADAFIEKLIPLITEFKNLLDEINQKANMGNIGGGFGFNTPGTSLTPAPYVADPTGLLTPNNGANTNQLTEQQIAQLIEDKYGDMLEEYSVVNEIHQIYSLLKDTGIRINN